MDFTTVPTMRTRAGAQYTSLPEPSKPQTLFLVIEEKPMKARLTSKMQEAFSYRRQEEQDALPRTCLLFLVSCTHRAMGRKRACAHYICTTGRVFNRGRGTLPIPARQSPSSAQILTKGNLMKPM